MTTDFPRNLFFSPDGQWLGFWSEGQLWRVAVSGGAAVRLCETPNPMGVTWGPDDTILLGHGEDGIWQVAGAGGTPEPLLSVKSGEQAHSPMFLPGDEWVLFTLLSAPQTDWDQADIVVQSLVTEERRVLIKGENGGAKIDHRAAM